MARRRLNLVGGGFLGSLLLVGALVGCNQGGGGEGEGGGGGGQEEEFALPVKFGATTVKATRHTGRRVKRSAPAGAR